MHHRVSVSFPCRALALWQAIPAAIPARIQSTLALKQRIRTATNGAEGACLHSLLIRATLLGRSFTLRSLSKLCGVKGDSNADGLTLGAPGNKCADCYTHSSTYEDLLICRQLGAGK